MCSPLRQHVNGWPRHRPSNRGNIPPFCFCFMSLTVPWTILCLAFRLLRPVANGSARKDDLITKRWSLILCAQTVPHHVDSCEMSNASKLSARYGKGNQYVWPNQSSFHDTLHWLELSYKLIFPPSPSQLGLSISYYSPLLALMPISSCCLFHCPTFPVVSISSRPL